MANPWEEISLSNYENHMKLDSVMILGIAGGNGLEHIDSSDILIQLNFER